MKSELNSNEKILKSGSANLQKNIETVGGKIHLTNERIVFESNKFNVQSGMTEIKISNIKSVNYCWTKFLGIIPLMPNSLSVLTKDLKTFQFVLMKRSEWKDAIEKLI